MANATEPSDGRQGDRSARPNSSPTAGRFEAPPAVGCPSLDAPLPAALSSAAELVGQRAEIEREATCRPEGPMPGSDRWVECESPCPNPASSNRSLTCSNR